jgi:hypothetical protein
MPKVTWTAQAEAELKALVSDPAVREQLKRNAEEILHYIPHPTVYPADEGAEDGIMWHRGVAHGRYTEQEEQDNGPQNYFLFYRPLDSARFEVVGVRSNNQIARRELMYGIFGYTADPAA